MPPFSGPPFSVELVTHYTSRVFRVSFTQEPLASSPSGPNDALNPANYTISGPQLISIVGIATTTDPLSVDITLAVPPALGQWTVAVASNVVSNVGFVIIAPLSYTFDVTDISLASPLNHGATNDTSDSIIRKHLSPAFKGTGWDSLIAGLAAGDALSEYNAIAIFDQLFTSTASGLYLDRRGSEYGITRPTSLGMGDDSYRNYIIRSVDKVTNKSIWELLETFYGRDSVSGFIETTAYEPFTLADGSTLNLLVDEETEINVEFNASDFNAIYQATADEVATIINRQASKVGSDCFAISVLDPELNVTKVKIHSGSLGLRSSIRVTSGTAQNILLFPSKIDCFTAYTVTWVLSVEDLNLIRFTTTVIGNTVDLTQVKVGDFVNLSGTSIDGSYPITNVGYSYVNDAQWFEIVADSSPAPTTPFNQTTSSQVVFHESVKSGIYNDFLRNVVVDQSISRTVEVVIPATTQVVNRTVGTGAYGQMPTTWTLTSISGPHDDITIDFGIPHPFTTNDNIQISGFRPDYELPTATPGSFDEDTFVGLNSVSPMRILDQISSIPIPPSGAPASYYDGRYSHMTAVKYYPGVSPAGMVYMFGGAEVGTGNIVNTAHAFLFAEILPGSYAYLYNPAIINVMAVAVADGSVATFGSDANFPDTVVVCGGIDAIFFTASSVIQSYDIGTDTWTDQTPATLATARAYHYSCVLDTGDVFVVGGNTNVCELVTPSRAGTWIVSAAATAPYGVGFYPGAVKLSSGYVVVSGGIGTDSQSESAFYNPGTGVGTDSWISFGEMAYRRYKHALVELPSGNVLAIGGIGRTVVSPAADADLDSIEILDINTGRWSYWGTLPGCSGQTKAVYGDDGKIYIVSKTGSCVLDPATNTFKKLIGTRFNDGQEGFSLDYVNGVAVIAGGNDTSITPSFLCHMVLPGEENMLASLNGEYEITGTTATTVTIQSPKPGYVNNIGTATVVTPMTAEANDIYPGPYVFSPDEGVGITGTSTTLTSALYQNQKYSLLEVANCASFPDEPGWLVLGFGQDYQTGPIRYLGKRSSTEMILEYEIAMTKDIPVGGDVCLLIQKGPWESLQYDIGAFHLTASAAGRVAAQTAIENSLAAGITSDISIVYPGDRGLGNEGSPTEGANKLSDVVEIWAGDEIDDEVQAAREEEV